MGPVEGNNRQDVNSAQGPYGPNAAQTEHAERMREIKQMSSGNMAGENLIVQDYNQDGIADADSTGARPTLSSPRFQSTLIGVQATMDQMDKANAMSVDETGQVLNQKMAGQPIHDVNRTPAPPITGMTQTDTSISATLGQNMTFHADMNTNSMQVVVDGRQVDFQMGENPLVQVDGQEVNYNMDELDALGMMFAILELFHKMGVESRQIHREARNTTNEGVVQNIQNQAEEQRSAATKQLVAGVVSGTAKVASAGLSFAGSVKGMKADAAAAQQGQPPNAFQGQMISQKYSALGSGIEGAGELGSSAARYEATQHEAQQTTLRAGEEQLKHVKQTEQDQMQAAQDLLTKARESFAQMQMQHIQTLQNTARNI